MAQICRRPEKYIENGATVKKGQIIGYIGSTGRSTGPHLHLELAKNSRTINPLSVKMIPEEKSVATVSNMKRFSSLKRYANNLSKDHH
jgi:murein DD-endopeptidase MepM/ murein hydrolase activator NlpD